MEVRPKLFAIAFVGLGFVAACAPGDPVPTGYRSPGRPADATPGTDGAGYADGAAGSGASVFTGTVPGTDARVSIIATKHHARFYFCGGDSTYTMLSRWVMADLGPSGEVTADNAADWSIDATVGETMVNGTLVTGDASRYSFLAMAVEKQTIAGLYEAVSPCGKVGVIVSQATESDAPVAQGACIGNGNISIHQVNPVLPLQKRPDGSISVVVAGETEEISVVPAAAPAN